MEADGGSRGNPGPAAYGALLRDAATGVVLASDAEGIGRATNNVAEYRGLIAGLHLAREHAPDAALEVRMDSRLVIEQMRGRWKVKHADLRPLAAQARELAPGGTTWTWVPRERNADADALLNRALDGMPAAAAEPGEGVGLDQPEAAETRVVGWSERVGVPTTFGLLRHGVTAHTREKRFSGSGGADPGLNDTGRAQAEAAADVLATQGETDAIVASPLRRTRETAEVVAKALGLDVSVEAGFAETAFGDWDGYTIPEVAERWPDELAAWRASTSVAPPGGESTESVAARVRAARDRVLREHPGRRVAVVSHVTPIKILVQLALDVPMSVLFRMELAPASLSEIEWYADGYASLRSFSVATHLDQRATGR